MIIAQGLIAFGLCIGIAINYVPLRTAIWSQIFPKNDFTVLR
jgi:hypothetical protein